MATLQPGDVVAVDALTYPGFKVLAQTLRLELAPLPATPDGPDLDALERLCAERPGPRRLRHAHAAQPARLGHGRRRPRADWSRSRAGTASSSSKTPPTPTWPSEPPPPLAALAPDITVYVSGLSKSVATGLRVGFVAAPAPLVPAIERAIRATTWNTPAITTAIACRWLDDGTVSRLEARKRDDARTRQSIARDVLAGLPLIGHPSSYFVWLPLPEDARADRIAASLSRDHISVSTAEPFAITVHAPQAIRLALGSTDLPGLRATLSKVRQVVETDAYL